MFFAGSSFSTPSFVIEHRMFARINIDLFSLFFTISFLATMRGARALYFVVSCHCFCINVHAHNPYYLRFSQFPDTKSQPASQLKSDRVLSIFVCCDNHICLRFGLQSIHTMRVLPAFWFCKWLFKFKTFAQYNFLCMRRRCISPNHKHILQIYKCIYESCCMQIHGIRLSLALNKYKYKYRT